MFKASGKWAKYNGCLSTVLGQVCVILSLSANGRSTIGDFRLCLTIHNLEDDLNRVEVLLKINEIIKKHKRNY